jgi:ribose 5-phosphate isomerase B
MLVLNFVATFGRYKQKPILLTMVEDMLEIAIACDHAGYILKLKLKKKLEEMGYTFRDFGADSEESVDYPDIIHPLATEINDGHLLRGIIICGSGNGVAMTANKYPQIRAALCWTPEIARFARLHNNANILSLPARFINEATAFDIAKVFLTTGFENGRHGRRVDKIPPKTL